MAVNAGLGSATITVTAGNAISSSATQVVVRAAEIASIAIMLAQVRHGGQTDDAVSTTDTSATLTFAQFSGGLGNSAN